MPTPPPRRRSAAVKVPDPIDLHVGNRLRLGRTLRGLSQTTLGSFLGLSLQQVRKYEQGTSRIGVATLHRLTLALDLPVGFFFDDMPIGPPAPAEDDVLVRRESLDLLRRYYRLPATMRQRVFDILKTLAGPSLG